MARKLVSFPTKTIRFSQVVDQCGTPEPYTLWTAPEKDAEFQRAVKGNRVMMVHQETAGSKKDFGVVGYNRDPEAQLLIFPRSLKGFEGKRIVGLKYDLLKDAPATTSRKDSSARKEKIEFPVFVKPPSHPAEVMAEEAPAEKSPPVREEKKKAAPKPEPADPAPESNSRAHTALISEVRKALKELQQGKAVAAYQRLEKALESAEA